MKTLEEKLDAISEVLRGDGPAWGKEKQQHVKTRLKEALKRLGLDYDDGDSLTPEQEQHNALVKCGVKQGELFMTKRQQEANAKAEAALRSIGWKP